MAKTNPIGVRFDEDLLKELKDDNLATSPQKALNFYEGYYQISKAVNSTSAPIDIIKEDVEIKKETPTEKKLANQKYKEGDPKEGSNAFFLKFGAKNYDDEDFKR